MAHSFSTAWKEVKCRVCGREYTCTPADDYYNCTNATDGVYEKCLLQPYGISSISAAALPMDVNSN